MLPVLTGTGEWAELTATPATWQRIAIALALHWSPQSDAPKPAPTAKPVCVRVTPRPPVTKPGTGRTR